MYLLSCHFSLFLLTDHWNGTPCTALLEAIRNRIDQSNKTYKQEFPPIFAALNLKMPTNLVPLLQKVKRHVAKAKSNRSILELAQEMPGLSKKGKHEIGPHCQEIGITPDSLLQAATTFKKVTNAMIIELHQFRERTNTTWQTVHVHDKWWPNLFEADSSLPPLGTIQSSWCIIANKRQQLRKEPLHQFLDTLYSIPTRKPPAQSIDTDDDSEDEDDDDTDLEFYPNFISEHTIDHMGDCMEYLTDIWQDEVLRHQDTQKELTTATKMTYKISKALEDAKTLNADLKKQIGSLQTKNVVHRLA